MKFISLKHVFKTYSNGVTALADINLEIAKGEFVFIIGPTGCGKSTLMKLLYREEKPTKGNVIVGGINVEKLRNRKVYKLRKKLGIIFQNYRLLPKQTVYENVAFPLSSDGIKDSEIRPKVIKALELVGLKEKIKSFPDELSGGEQQRVCIARAIVNAPKLLLCDEPTGNLDPKVSKEIMDVIESINKKLGTTIIMVTHDAQIVNRMKKRVISISNGVVTNDIMKGKYKENENN
jgi:cell division transport system ATP-binding protein